MNWYKKAKIATQITEDTPNLPFLKTCKNLQR